MEHRQKDQQSAPTAAATGLEGVLAELDDMRLRLDELKVELERSHRLSMLGILAAAIAHELNNLLTPALNVSEMALAAPDDPLKAQSALERSTQAILRASEISHSILAFATAKDDTFHVEPDSDASCAVDAVVRETLEFLGRDPQRHGIEVTVDAPVDCHAAIRPVALQQILLNLFINSVKAMPTGGRLFISASTIVNERSMHEVAIDVTDNGSGIDADKLETIFESFVTFHREAGGAGHASGYGLGLMVCRHLVEAAGGQITVSSTVGEGTTFRVVIPDARRELRRKSA
jgi:signal transduction histidine kinase